MKRKLLFFSLFFASILLFAVQTIEAFGVVAFHADFFKKRGTVIIDAGHGGEDGGAVGINQALEKEINLAIALELEKNLKANHFEVLMTRDGDYSIGDQNLGTVAERKRSDTKQRVQIVKEAGKNCILVSIHQNHFSESKYHGAQMFYSKNHPQSAILAEAVRKNIVLSLQPENKRENKEGEGIYLLEHCMIPAVLVECGFLSNPEEAEKLCQKDYQEEMAAAIYNGLIDYFSEQKDPVASEPSEQNTSFAK